MWMGDVGRESWIGWQRLRTGNPLIVNSRTLCRSTPPQPPEETGAATHLLAVEFTLVLLLERREIIESPQLTTVPLLMENVRRRYRSSLCLGL